MTQVTLDPSSTKLGDLQVTLLCPFDIDFEPDLPRLARDDVSVARVQPGPAGIQCIEIPRTAGGPVALGDTLVAKEATVHAHVYRFGTGIVRVQFERDEWDLAALAELSARAEEVLLDGRLLVDRVRELGVTIRKRLEPYALVKYETLLDAIEVYPVFRAGDLPGGIAGDGFCEQNRRILASIVGGDGRLGRLSAFALEEYPVRNMGAVREDVVVVREAGSLVHISSDARGPRGLEEAVLDARRIEGLVELAYAQYWSLRSVDLVIQHLQDQAYVFTAGFLQKDPVVTLGAVTRALYRAREEHMAISNIVDDFIEIPAIGYDAYLDALYKRTREVFGVQERSRTAQERLEDLEKSYETVHAMINERRLMTLEILVLVVIVIELLVAVVELLRRT